MLFWLMIFFVVLFAAFAVSPIFLKVPFMPVHKKQAKKMMEFAGIKQGMKVIDLGSGAGRLLFLAEEKGATAIGYELNPFLFLWTKLMIFLKNKRGKVDVKFQSIYDADIGDADVILMFLFPQHMKKIEEKIFSETKQGAVIASYAFSAPKHAPTKHEDGIFVYQRN